MPIVDSKGWVDNKFTLSRSRTTIGQRIIRNSFHGITVVEEEVGSVNRILSRRFAESARAGGMKVVFLTLVEDERMPSNGD
jgi:hypothetical protein